MKVEKALKGVRISLSFNSVLLRGVCLLCFLIGPGRAEEAARDELDDLMPEVSSPVLMGLFKGRTPESRQAAEAQYGGGVEKFSEPVVSKALKWLKTHQQKDGSWNVEGTPEGEGNVICTSLALLAFIGHGETPASAEYGATVSKALQYLVAQQDEQGVFRPVDADPVTGQAIASYALAEAFIMTENPVLRESLKRGIEVMRLQMGNPEEKRGTLSGAWQVQALSSASWVFRGDPEVGKLVQLAMDEMLLRSGKQEVNKTTVAAEAFALHLARRMNSEELREAIQFLGKYTLPDTVPRWGNSKVDAEPGGGILFWYLAVNAFFCEDPAGDNFGRFMPALVKALVQNQAEDGHWNGYTEEGKRLGPVVNTSLASMSLMVFYVFHHVNYVYIPVPGEFDQEADEVEEEEGVEFDF